MSGLLENADITVLWRGLILFQPRQLLKIVHQLVMTMGLHPDTPLFPSIMVSNLHVQSAQKSRF